MQQRSSTCAFAAMCCKQCHAGKLFYKGGVGQPVFFSSCILESIKAVLSNSHSRQDLAKWCFSHKFVKNYHLMTVEQKRPLSNLQLELLKLYATDIPDNQLLEIKQLLVNYFAQQVDEEMTKLWESNNWDEKTIESWKNERLRSPY